MYKYDIPFPKKGQYSLLINGAPANNSKKKSYLIEKMNAHRNEMIDYGLGDEQIEYTIVDPNGSIVLKKVFAKGERGNTEEPYHKVKEDETVYIQKDGFNLIGDSEGNVVTDEILLRILNDFNRYERIPVMITKAELVQMATYKPLAKDAFIKLKGLGEKKYDKCGEAFIGIIKAYIEKSNKDETKAE